MNDGLQSRADYLGLIPGTRASDADRDCVAGHLNHALFEGRIDPVTHKRRVDAALKAETQAELAVLVTDVEPKVRTDALAPLAAWREKSPWAFHMTGFIAAILVAAVPSTAAYGATGGHSPWLPAVMVPSILTGVIILIFTIISGASMIDS